MDTAYRIRCVFVWVLAGLLAGAVAGAPMAHTIAIDDAGRNDPAPPFRPQGFDAPGPVRDDTPIDAAVNVAAAERVMWIAMAAGLAGGLLVGLARNRFLSPHGGGPTVAKLP